MDPRTALKLVERIQDLERKTPVIRLGTVTDIAPLAVALGGSDVPYASVKALDGETLAVDDVIAAVMFGRDLLVLGRIGDGTQPAWTNASLQGAWANVVGYTARYFKDTAGFVHVDGRIKDGTSGTTAFTLPAGSRPGQNMQIALCGSGVNLAAAVVGSDGTFVVHWTNNNTDIGITIPPFLAEN